MPHPKKAFWKASYPIPTFCYQLTYSENCINILIFPKAIHTFTSAYVAVRCNPDCLGILRMIISKEEIKHPYFFMFDCMRYIMCSTYLLIALKRWGGCLAWPNPTAVRGTFSANINRLCSKARVNHSGCSPALLHKEGLVREAATIRHILYLSSRWAHLL